MIEQVTAGIDWLSISMHNGEAEYNEWLTKCYKAVEYVASAGNVLTNRSLLGYVGVSAGNCFIGEGINGAFAQFTGQWAERAFDAVYSPNAKVSRLDVQLTAKFDIMDKNIAKGAYRAAIRANEALPVGRRRKVWIIVGSDGGDTTYIGSASSEQRGRIYNKEVQSEVVAYTRCWRYEVVYRNDLSTQLARLRPREVTNRADWYVSVVAEWFQRRGVALSWVQSGLVAPMLIQKTQPTDIERKLEWLRLQVAPTVRYLLEQGYRDTLLVSLGLESDLT